MNNKIKDKIVELDMSIATVAHCVSVTYLHAENKILRNNWTAEEVLKLAKLFNCKIEDLI